MLLTCSCLQFSCSIYYAWMPFSVLRLFWRQNASLHHLSCRNVFWILYVRSLYNELFFFFLSQKRKHLTMTMFLKYFVHRLKKKKYFWSFCNTGEDVIKSPGFLFQSQKNIFFFFLNSGAFIYFILCSYLLFVWNLSDIYASF